MKNKILSLFLSLLIIVAPTTASAADYTSDYPNYIPYSGGTYCEVHSTLGRGAFVLQNTYKANYFGFYGNSVNICNLSNSTLTGRFILQNGTSYTMRFSAFSTAQYQYTSGYTSEWRDLGITQIYNTNIEFIDDTSLDRGNVFDVFNDDPYKYAVVCGLFLLVIISGVSLFRRSNRC